MSDKVGTRLGKLSKILFAEDDSRDDYKDNELETTKDQKLLTYFILGIVVVVVIVVVIINTLGSI
jgi:hypothetical protein